MIKKVLATTASLVFALLLYLVFDIWQHKSQQNQEVQRKAENNMRVLHEGIGEVVQAVSEITEQFASDIQGMPELAKSELEKEIIRRVKSMDEILGITVAYEPYAFDADTKLYSPYFDKNKNEMIYVEDVYDYTDQALDTAQWYVQVRDNGARWVEPYYARAAQALVSDYGIPFYYQDGPKKGLVRGTVTTTISLSGFTDLVQALNLGSTGFGFVASEQGMLMAHPIREYVGAKTLSELEKDKENSDTKNVYRSIRSGESGIERFFEPTKNQELVFAYDRLDSNGWTYALQFYRNDILGPDTQIKHKIIHVALVASFLCFLLITIYFNRDFLSTVEIWQLSALASVILFGNILLTGYLQHKDTYNTERLNSPPIIDETYLSNVVEQQKKTTERFDDQRLRIRPVGLHLENMEFKNSYNVNISGRAWIKYLDVPPEEGDVAFHFPQIAPFAESHYFEESYRKRTESHTLVVYEFRSTLRLNFNYSLFPFDKRHIAIELLPKDNAYNEMFVPDFEGYLYSSPAEKIGVSQGIRLPGNKILESYFSYKSKTQKTRFGEALNNRLHKKPPSLHFNISMQRNLVTAFVTYLVPIFISLIMMFILLCAAEKSTDSLAGGGIVQGLAAFFFVLVFSHIDLRKDLLTGELVYIEYFYFIAYLMIVLCSVNLIVYTRKSFRFFDYQKNIVFKTGFWPLFFSILLFITLVKFY